MSALVLVAVPSALAAAFVLARGPHPERRLAGRSVRRWPLAFLMIRQSLAAPSRRRGAALVAGAWVEAWAAAMRAGRPVGGALDDAFADVTGAARLLPRTAAAGALGGDVAVALRHDAAEVAGGAGRTVLAAAACWTVARDNGGRLADALDRLGEAVRAEAVHVAHVRAQLAGPRATARLLAGLPVFAIVLGTSMGLDPVAVLLGDPLGRAALVGGVVLDVAGLVWTERMARAAERTA